MSDCRNVAVAYLARGIGAGLPSVQAFLDSYFSRRPRHEHRLYVLLKGWDRDSGYEQVVSLAKQAGADVIKLPDDGYDWGAYFRFASMASEGWLFFVNTHSRILHDGWLEILMSHAQARNVGIVGCTGSLGTMAPIWQFNWPVAKDVFHYRGWLKGCLYLSLCYPYSLWKYVLAANKFPSFPNPHVRSNAFLIRTDLFRQFCANHTVPRTKMDAFELESGYRGLTRFINERGQDALVAGLDGISYHSDEWMESNTFRVPEQENLLIADNQTNAYKNGSEKVRRIMEISAWGKFFTEQGSSVKIT